MVTNPAIYNKTGRHYHGFFSNQGGLRRMAKVKSHKIENGTRISSYKVLDDKGRGWEGQVYKVVEVPTEAIRAMKLFRTGDLDSIRYLAHVAWYFEQVRDTGHFPIYHHCGQWFFEDDNGCWFLVFEFIDGVDLSKLAGSEALFLKLAKAVAAVHQSGYGVGDLSSLKNVFKRKKDERIIFVDCEPGKPDRPNTDFSEDCTVELAGAARKMFKGKPPTRVKEILKALKASKLFKKDTLENVLREAGAYDVK